jgi:hypothetical protein
MGKSTLNRLFTALRLLTCLAVLPLFQGCESVPADTKAQTVVKQDYKKIEEIELIMLNYRFSNDATLLGEAETRLKAIVASASYNKEYEAALYGIAGVIANNRKNMVEVRRDAESCEARSKTNGYVFILKAYLESDVKKKEAILESGLAATENLAVLRLELAELLFDLGVFNKATALYDEGLKDLHPDYRAAYQKKRDLAFQFISNPPPNSLKNIDILSAEVLTASQAVTLVLGTTDYLSHIWPYKNSDIKPVFEKLRADDYLPASLADPGQIIPRRDCAYFFLHLVAYLENNPSLLSKYAKQYNTNKMSSPIPDVRVDAYFFDAVLLCVERELLELPDGINFYPERPVSGVEFNAALKKLRTKYGR